MPHERVLNLMKSGSLTMIVIKRSLTKLFHRFSFTISPFWKAEDVRRRDDEVCVAATIASEAAFVWPSASSPIADEPASVWPLASS